MLKKGRVDEREYILDGKVENQDSDEADVGAQIHFGKKEKANSNATLGEEQRKEQENL